MMFDGSFQRGADYVPVYPRLREWKHVGLAIDAGRIEGSGRTALGARIWSNDAHVWTAGRLLPRTPRSAAAEAEALVRGLQDVWICFCEPASPGETPLLICHPGMHAAGVRGVVVYEMQLTSIVYVVFCITADACHSLLV